MALVENSQPLINVEQSSIFNNRVLVVDDDPVVLQTYEELLDTSTFGLSDFDFLHQTEGSDEGSDVDFQMDSAQQGEEAIECVRSALERGEPYAVIFLDMRMPPGIDGLEVAEQIRTMDDNVYFVFVTAYSDHTIDEMQDILHKNTLLLTKPFHHDVVLQMARTLCISWAREQCLEITRERLTQLSAKMAEQASHDALTGLFNRYYMDQQIEREIKRSRRDGLPLAILMIDIDWFKRYNDQHGHLLGDQALQKIANALQQVVMRGGDFVARYGGEEFCMVLPNTDIAGAGRVAERARQSVEALQLRFVGASEEQLLSSLTVSIGGVSRIPHADERDSILIHEADQLLYQMKESGKNRVLVA